MVQPQPPPLTISLFELLRRQLATSLPIVRCSKATLVHLSHTLEDIILTNHVPAMLFTGFQESSHWREETERYRALAEIAQQVCIFAGGTLPPESNASQLHVTLGGDDPLRQEWFVVILSQEFSVLLCGQDRLEPGAEEPLRQFDTFWSFAPDVITPALDLLEQVIAHYRPERLEQLKAARASYGTRQPDATLVSHFSIEMIRYEEELQRALQQSNAALDEQLRWRESLTQTLVHDLRTPLQGLIMALGIIADGVAYDQQTVDDTLRIARRTASELESLIQMLLDTNQLEAGQLTLLWRPNDLDQLIQSAVESLRPLLDAGDLNMRISLPETLKIVWGDQGLLKRVLQNLIGNALKFTAPGGMISIEATDMPSGDLIELRVRDTGSGIPPSMLPHIFERNVKGSRSDRRGSGLGLYFCRLAVEAHGCSIRADSQLGRGTVITFQLKSRLPQ